jgi:hypothetical protein
MIALRLPQSMRRILVLLGLLLAAGCAGPVKSLYPPRPGEPVRSVYVVTHGDIHTGIAVERADISTNTWPANHDYPAARYLEVGWGDDDGYRKPFTCWIVFKALFWPTRSVLQLDGFTNSITENFDDPSGTIIEIQLSERGFERLCRRIGNTYALDKTGQPIVLGDDWYRARGKYCIFKTCNTWVASALREAGCPITPAYCITRGPLLRQAKKFGRVVPVEKSGAPPAKK